MVRCIVASIGEQLWVAQSYSFRVLCKRTFS